MRNLIRIILTFVMVIIIVIGIAAWYGLFSDAPPNILVPTPATLSEALEYLSSYAGEERVAGAHAIRNFGSESVTAIPYLVDNLSYEANSTIVIAAARALGDMGKLAEVAVPELIDAMQNDDYIHVKRAVAEALGKIGEPSSIPFLVENLNHKDEIFAIKSAAAIAKITGEAFVDASAGGSYQTNEEGIPLILLVAQTWWEDVGQYQDWKIDN